jgi:hypothetical protein
MRTSKYPGLLFILILCFSLAACGGGGGSISVASSSNNSGGSSSGSHSATVTGQLKASYINGVKVCVVDEFIGTSSENCAVTDNLGDFSLESALGKTIEVRLGSNIVVGKASADTTSITLTPTTLAGGDTKIATRIANLFHQAGSTTDNQTYDLSALQSTSANTAAFGSYLKGETNSFKIGDIVVCSVPAVTLDCTTTKQAVDCSVTWAPPEGFVGISYDPIIFTITGALPVTGPGTKMSTSGDYWRTDNVQPVSVTTALPVTDGQLTTVTQPVKHAAHFTYTATGSTTIKATIFETIGADCTFKGGGSATYDTTIAN